MLLEFRLANYRSFRTEEAFSLVASTDKTLQAENTIETLISGTPRALRAAAIYGANASGKTNLVRALQLMRGVVVESAALKPDQTFNLQSFQLDENSKTAPTLFEVTVVLDGVRHQYGFEFTRNRITREWLLVYKRSKPQAWFDRSAASEGPDDVRFSAHLAGPKQVWREVTRNNALLLSTAVQLNGEALRPLFNWFASSLVIFLEGGLLPHDFTTQLVETPSGSSRVQSFLSAADIGISSITTWQTKAFGQSLHVDLATGQSTSTRLDQEVKLPRFHHSSGQNTAAFELFDESQGTQKLYSLAAPLFDVLEKGMVLVIDELDRSLHPLLVRKIINTFQNPELNRHGAQLIFTTHDTAQLGGPLLRRDQIWLTEKQQDQSSTLVPLADFSPRKGEALEKGYLAGRYGGVPILANDLFDEGAFGEK